ncbi:MarR family transcriptional regulator [Flavobacterium sp. xlx-214]|uniref:MarR family winged helix-turn-helix transcriptional regulator n=1 Tax=unclassified Flavobacterium TaxID=196869 RepID=UPI0013D17863|nr:MULTISPECIES: MarR family transcriptional regulator [unclassified Flavobacterium]MBA5791710.1 MarR family transcriptional regulator [Flavobacterium sp. xlx-221]QMI82950.1 MarR family transcriptional regulator [Flavobacterium sp. xlx-214]
MSDKIEFIFKTPEKSPGFLLAQLTLLWQRKQKKVLDPLDLTQTQFILLASIAWLTNKSDNVTQVEIANLNNFDRMMVSKVLRTMQEKKLITRKEHGTDTRAKIVKLTTNGEKVLQIALTKVENADIEFFESIDKQLPDFNLSMKKLIETNKEI